MSPQQTRKARGRGKRKSASSVSPQMQKVLSGLDASRRAGWAQAYSTERQLKKLRDSDGIYRPQVEELRARIEELELENSMLRACLRDGTA